MPDLLIELFSEEIPARMQTRAAEDLRKRVTDGLVEAGLTYAHAAAFHTPRRLTLTVEGPAGRKPDHCARNAKARAPTRPTRRSTASCASTGLTRDQLTGARRQEGPGLVRGDRKTGPPGGRRSWPRCWTTRSAISPGPSRCAGARAACAGSARCTRSCACYTTRLARTSCR